MIEKIIYYLRDNESLVTNVVIFSLLSIFVWIGLFLIYWALKQIQKSQKVKKNWRKIPAQILNLDYLVDTGFEADKVFLVKILYQYQIDGKQYQNSTIGTGYFCSSNQEYHQRIYNILLNKKIINIYCDISHPEKSVISASPGQTPGIAISVGIMFIFCGFGAMALHYTSQISNFNASVKENLQNILGLMFYVVFALCSWRAGYLISFQKADKLTKEIMMC